MAVCWCVLHNLMALSSLCIIMVTKTLTYLVVTGVFLYVAFVHRDKVKIVFDGFMHTLKSMINRKSSSSKRKGKPKNLIPKTKFPCFRCNKIYDSQEGLHIHDCKYVRPDLNKQKEVKKFGYSRK